MQYLLLENRTIIKVEGDDAIQLLQGIITNDMNLVLDNHSIYALMLTPQGKFLHDFFIIKLTDQSYLLDVAVEKKNEIISKLNIYKLRSKVKITDLSDRYQIISLNLINANQLGLDNNKAGYTVRFDYGIFYLDPRFTLMGARGIIDKEKLELTSTAEWQFVGNVKDYEEIRYNYAIPKGYIDMIQEKSFPLEFGMDKLNAINYEKGCYVGQELTARTTYRGVIRKGIFQLQSQQAFTDVSGEEIFINDLKIGKIISVYNKFAIAMLRFAELEQAASKEATIMGNKVVIYQPMWR